MIKEKEMSDEEVRLSDDFINCIKELWEAELQRQWEEIRPQLNSGTGAV